MVTIKRFSLNQETLRRLQFALPLVTLGIFGLAYWLLPSFQHEVDVVISILSNGDLEGLRAYILSYGNWAPFVSLLLMVFQALAAPVPSFLITFTNGLAFGVVWGCLLSVAGHALAAMVCYWLARSLGRRPVESLIGRIGLDSVDRWINRRGALAIFVVRLLPGVSFDAVSYAAGLTGMGFGRFILASVAGIFPQTLLYVYLGQQAPQYAWMLLVASAVIILGSAVIGLLGWARRRPVASSQQQRRERGDGRAAYRESASVW